MVSLLRILYQLSQYRTAYAASVAAFNTADDAFQVASMQRERALIHRENCMKKYMEFEAHADNLTQLAAIPDQQFPGKNSQRHL